MTILPALLLALGALGATLAPEDPTPGELLRRSRRALEEESGTLAEREEAVRALALLAIEEPSLRREVSRELTRALDHADRRVAGEAARVLAIALGPDEAGKELASRLRRGVRTLRRFMDEVEHRRRTRSLRFLRDFPEMGEDGEQVARYPAYLENLARALAECPAARGADALAAVLELDPSASSDPLVRAAFRSSLELEDPDALEAVVDWLRRHEPDLAEVDAERGRGDARFGRLEGLKAFREQFPPVDAATAAAVRSGLGEWAERRGLEAPPAADEAQAWRDWLRVASRSLAGLRPD